MDAELVKRFWTKVSISEPNACWPWTGSKRGSNPKNLYGGVKIDGKTYQSHRVAFAIELGIELEQVPDLLRHTCDFGLCCNPNHLVPGTHIDNTQDRVIRGRSARPLGEKNPQAILSDSSVIDIRRLIRSGMKNKRIAEIYGVTPATISYIKTGKTWPHLIGE